MEKGNLSQKDIWLHVLDSVKTFWSYYAVLAAVVGILTTFGVKKILSAKEQDNLVQAVKDLTIEMKNVRDTTLYFFQINDARLSRIENAQTEQGLQMSDQATSQAIMETNWKMFLKENKDVSKELYSRLTEGLNRVVNEVKKNSWN